MPYEVGDRHRPRMDGWSGFDGKQQNPSRRMDRHIYLGMFKVVVDENDELRIRETRTSMRYGETNGKEPL